MTTNAPIVLDNISCVESLIHEAELQRNEKSILDLQRHLNNNTDLLPTAQILADGLFERMINYIGSADNMVKQNIRKRYMALWQMFVEDNKSGVVGLLLAKEIILSAILLEFSTEKLVRHINHSTSTDGRLMESVHSRHMRSLKMYKKLNGYLPDIEFNINQFSF
jgi:hypothetical protein